MTTEYTFEKFNPANLADDKVIAIVAPRGRGKTFMIDDIMFHKRHIPYGVVMCGTLDTREKWKTRVPECNIHSKYKRPVIRQMLKSQERLLRQVHGDKDRLPPAFIVLDDVTCDSGNMNTDKEFKKLLYNGRHLNLFVILASQYVMDLKPHLRSQIDVVIALQHLIVTDREKLYKHFFGVIPNKEIFHQVMAQCTNNYEALVMDNSAYSSGANHVSKPEDMLKWYKASAKPDYRIGSTEFWEFWNKRQKDQSEMVDTSSDSEEEPSSKGKRKKRSTGKTRVRKKAKKGDSEDDEELAELGMD